MHVQACQTKNFDLISEKIDILPMRRESPSVTEILNTATREQGKCWHLLQLVTFGWNFQKFASKLKPFMNGGGRGLYNCDV